MNTGTEGGIYMLCFWFVLPVSALVLLSFDDSSVLTWGLLYFDSCTTTFGAQELQMERVLAFSIITMLSDGRTPSLTCVNHALVWRSSRIMLIQAELL